MPTIVVHKEDFLTLLGHVPDTNELARAKSQLVDILDDELKIEIADTNRPDLWSAEGIVRELSGPKEYSFFDTSPQHEVIVSPEVLEVRPYIGAFLVKDIKLTDISLRSIIQSQEKLSDLYGRGRRDIAIGIYDASKIVFPIHYRGVHPSEVRFTPLDMTEALSLAEILDKHPKGIEYGHLIKSCKFYPLLVDNDNKVLSFPPIINSRDIGEVTPTHTYLFCETTGTNLEMVLLVTNILATNFADRGAQILPILIVYPDGKKVKTPHDISEPWELSPHEVQELLGISLDMDEIHSILRAANYRIKDGKLYPPPWRADIMSVADIIEDIAIHRGYNTFTPLGLTDFTVGHSTPIEELIEDIRNIMVGIGFEEILSHVLTSKDNLIYRMNLPERKIIEIDNVMSLSYSVLRDTIIPSLLEVESLSSKSLYPHKLFEVGEVVIYDPGSPEYSRTVNHLAAIVAHPQANFSETHSYLNALFHQLNLTYKIEPTSHPSYIPGRVAKILVNNHEIGIIGELHPEVLTRWNIKVPVTAFEIEIDAIG